MGGTEITEIIIKAAPVAVDLLGTLFKWLNSTPTADVSVARKGDHDGARDGTYEALYQDGIAVATSEFLASHGYAYMGDDSTPSSAKEDSKIGSNEDFYNAQANNLSAVTTAVTNNIKGTVAPWAQKHLINDLASRITSILAQPATEAFITKPFTLSYTDSDSGKVFQMDLSWIYCTTSAPDPKHTDTNVETLFLYSVGVAYEATAWLERLVNPSRIPVVRLAFSYSIVKIGDAIASFIMAAKDKEKSKIQATVKTGGGVGEIVVAGQGNKLAYDSFRMEPAIDYQWALNALQITGVTKVTTSFGVATTDEAQEFQYLKSWESEAAGL